MATTSATSRLAGSGESIAEIRRKQGLRLAGGSLGCWSECARFRRGYGAGGDGRTLLGGPLKECINALARFPGQPQGRVPTFRGSELRTVDEVLGNGAMKPSVRNRIVGFWAVLNIYTPARKSQEEVGTESPGLHGAGR